VPRAATRSPTACPVTTQRWRSACARRGGLREAGQQAEPDRNRHGGPRNLPHHGRPVPQRQPNLINPPDCRVKKSRHARMDFTCDQPSAVYVRAPPILSLHVCNPVRSSHHRGLGCAASERLQRSSRCRPPGFFAASGSGIFLLLHRRTLVTCGVSFSYCACWLSAAAPHRRRGHPTRRIQHQHAQRFRTAHPPHQVPH
jgi:hypothetical protein